MKSPSHFADTFTFAGASRLQALVQKFWADRGHDVRVWLDPFRRINHGPVLWAVRSDLVNGMPAADG